MHGDLLQSAVTLLAAAATADSRVTQSPAVTIEQVQGEAILYDSRRGEVHVVNASAGRLWDLCERRPTISELTTALAESYDLPADAVRDDVLAVLEQFLDKELIELTAGPNSET